MTRNTGHPVTDTDEKVAKLEEQVSEIFRQLRSYDAGMLDITKSKGDILLEVREIGSALTALNTLYEERQKTGGKDMERIERAGERNGETTRQVADKLLAHREEMQKEIRVCYEEINKVKAAIVQKESRARGWLDSANALWLLFGGVIATGIGWLASQAFERN